MRDTSRAAADDLIWKALADGTRRALLDTLSRRPHTTGELVELQRSLCRTAVMKHLDVLEAAGLLVVTRSGRQRWNHLNPVPIAALHERWVAPHVRGTAAALSRLKSHLESDGRRAVPAGASPPRTRKDKPT